MSGEKSALARIVENFEVDDLLDVQKALVVSEENGATVVASAPNQKPGVEAEQNYFLGAGAILPRYDPWSCVALYEKSSALRPCVDSYATNIDGFGFRLEAVIDLEKADADKRVRAALRQQRLAEHEMQEVTDADVKAATEMIRREQEIEEHSLETFFAYCSPDSSFVELRMRTREDLEITGNAYWEIIRNGAKQVENIARIDAVTMRLRPIDLDYINVMTSEKISPIAYRKRAVPRRFRTYVQIINGMMCVYFKEFGDPRIVSSRTGRAFKTRAELRRSEGADAIEATEVMHFRTHSPIGPYGVPRWVGATMNIVGLRASEEVNYSYFDNKAIPPMAVLVSGGSLKAGAVEKIEKHLKENHKGRENFHGVLVIEADTPAAAPQGSRVRITIQPLMDAQLKDALFQVYETNSAKKIGKQFRLPDLLRGESEETNRAQAEAVLQMAEQQVFQPIRESFDHFINRRLFADMGIRHWTFASNAAKSTDAEVLSKLYSQFVKDGVLTPNEGRIGASEALNKEFKPLDADWAKQPLPLTLAGVSAVLPGSDGLPATQFDATTTPEQKSEDLAARVLRVRQALRAGSDAHNAAATEIARASDASSTIKLSRADFDELVDPHPPAANEA